MGAAVKVTTEALVKLGIQPTQAKQFAQSLAAACSRFDINTPSRIAGFVAQCNVESDGFRDLEENLWWTTPERILKYFTSRVTGLEHAARLTRNPQALANCVYAGKNGNGDESSGDGWRYRGRGLKQLTGRANYHDAAVALGRPYVEQPDLVAQPDDAALTAAWFWHHNKLNLLADSGQWNAITRAVNGRAMAQADLRHQLSEFGARALA
jgi:putative chitinase